MVELVLHLYYLAIELAFYGDVVEHRTAMRGVPGSILSSGVDFSEPLLHKVIK
jgi:hypothetical protein